MYRSKWIYAFKEHFLISQLESAFYCGKNSYIIVMYTAIYRICREVIDGVKDDYSDDEDTELPFDWLWGQIFYTTNYWKLKNVV